MYKMSERSMNRLKGINPDLILLVQESIKVTPMDFGIPRLGGMRTMEEQKVLFAKGASKADGERRLSYHQSGNAFDFYAYVDRRASWEEHHLSLLYGVFNTVALQLIKEKKVSFTEIVWGGTFSSGCFSGWDMGHIQVATCN